MAGTKSQRQPTTGFSVSRDAHAHLQMLSEPLFTRMLAVERKRTERSGRRFVLMLLACSQSRLRANADLQDTLVDVVTRTVRDTDLKGWYRQGTVLGVIFTEIGPGDDKAIVHTVSSKITKGLYDRLSIREINDLKISFHIYPEDWDGPDEPVSASLQLAMAEELKRSYLYLGLKRLIDVTGSLTALVLCLPLFAVIILAIRLTSKGPVLFRQVRLGQYGRKFTFLKFRSMYVNNDHTIHEAYVQKFMAGNPGTDEGAGVQPVYKLVADPRVTPVGRFLRKTSLDELPQFFNVLTGEMSLVGPRPPVMYEYKRYNLWHKQRLLAVKPGITGLWQVDGRSRVKFDEMVRLDIRYARSCSIWLDLKILLQTPRAVLSGDGAC